MNTLPPKSGGGPGALALPPRDSAPPASDEGDRPDASRPLRPPRAPHAASGAGPDAASAAILLAAGASRRLGRPKQLVRLEGEPLVRRGARMALEAGCRPVVVVLGAQAEAIAPALEGLEVICVSNPRWEAGLASSIRAGLDALPAATGSVLLLLCDQVGVDAPLLHRLIRAGSEAPDYPVACAYDGCVGVPSLFPARFFPQLRTLAGDAGAKGILAALGNQVILVPFPEGGQDVDRPEDAESLR